MEPSKAVKDSRAAEIAWMIVIAILVAAGGNVVLGLLLVHRAFGSVLLGIVVVIAALAMRRSYDPHSATARQDVTKAVGYLAAAVFAFASVGLHVHWAIGACIAAAEVTLVFDIITIAARPPAAPGAQSG